MQSKSARLAGIVESRLPSPGMMLTARGKQCFSPASGLKPPLPAKPAGRPSTAPDPPLQRVRALCPTIKFNTGCILQGSAFRIGTDGVSSEHHSCFRTNKYKSCTACLRLYFSFLFYRSTAYCSLVYTLLYSFILYHIKLYRIIPLYHKVHIPEGDETIF